MPDRKKGPISHKIDNLYIPDIEIYQWSNGTKVCEINMGSQEILKIEVVHLAGRSKEDFPLISRAASSLLKDGCGNKSSADIAEEIDFLGASIKTASNMDLAYTSVYTLCKHADKIIPLLHEMYQRPTYAEDEIEKYKKLNIQKLKEELTKNEVIKYIKKGTEKFNEMYVDRFDDCISILRETVKLDNDFPLLHTKLGIMIMMKGMHFKSEKLIEEGANEYKKGMHFMTELGFKHWQ